MFSIIVKLLMTDNRKNGMCNRVPTPIMEILLETGINHVSESRHPCPTSEMLAKDEEDSFGPGSCKFYMRNITSFVFPATGIVHQRFHLVEVYVHQAVCIDQNGSCCVKRGTEFPGSHIPYVISSICGTSRPMAS
jgi:hypothetical protein